ncbi:MAG: hypothetical protein KC493_13645 [Bacteriovoracaceae bacterium]|nr:hypothetical protein [Bacteriovoracaceae bacterium]
MKYLTIVILVLISFSVSAYDSIEFIAKTKTNFRSHVDSFVKINKNDELFALVAKKTERRGFNGCRMHRGTTSTRRCRVTTTKFSIPNLTLKGNDIVYDNGATAIHCGVIKDYWYGRKVKLSDNCNVINRAISGYTITEFLVTE